MNQQNNVLDGISGGLSGQGVVTADVSFGWTGNHSVLNCNPGLFWPQQQGSTNITTSKPDFSVEFVKNGFILTHNNQKYVASNLNNLFKAMAKIVEEKIEEVKEKKEKIK